MVDGLIKRGHRRIGFLTLPEQQIASGLRADGYVRALKTNGIEFDEQLVQVGALPIPANEFDLLWDALDRVLRAEPTVICCANDKMAMRVYGLLRERGLAIPRDISVAGYDDYRMIAEHLHPGLTSAQLPYAAMGARAAEKLLRIIAGTQRPAEPARELVSGPVVWRDSVQPRDNTITHRSTRRKDT